jgi:hypothetical protein
MRFLLYILSFILVVCCTGSDKKAEERLNAAEFNVVNVNGEFSMAIPKYMTEAKNLNEDAALQYQNVFKETYVIVIDEVKQEMIGTFREVGEYDTTLSVAENYRNIQLRMLEEGITINARSKPEAVKVGNLDAQQVQIDGNVEGISQEIAYFLSFVEGKEKVYMIMAWTIKDRKEKYRKTFDKIAKSFRLI